MNPMAKPSGFGNREKGYHAAHTNKNQGQKTHGKFKNDGQKGGKHTAIKSVKEKVKNQGQLQFMKKVIGGMRSEGTKLRRINMLPNSGAFH